MDAGWPSPVTMVGVGARGDGNPALTRCQLRPRSTVRKTAPPVRSAGMPKKPLGAVGGHHDGLVGIGRVRHDGPAVEGLQPLDAGPEVLPAVFGDVDTAGGGGVDHLRRRRADGQAVDVRVAALSGDAPGGAPVVRAHDASHLDPGEEGPLVGGVGHDDHHVGGVGREGVAPLPVAGHLAQGLPLGPGLAPVLADQQLGRVGAGDEGPGGGPAMPGAGGGQGGHRRHLLPGQSVLEGLPGLAPVRGADGPGVVARAQGIAHGQAVVRSHRGDDHLSGDGQRFGAGLGRAQASHISCVRVDPHDALGGTEVQHEGQYRPCEAAGRGPTRGSHAERSCHAEAPRCARGKLREASGVRPGPGQTRRSLAALGMTGRGGREAGARLALGFSGLRQRRRRSAISRS